jgi:hypothetical protein
MTLEFGAFSVSDAKIIRQRVLGDSRKIPLTTDSKTTLQKQYYGVLTEDLDAATHALTGATTAKVRIIRHLDRAARTMELAPGDGALYTVVNRCTEIEFERGTFVIFSDVSGEWVITGANCGPDSSLIAALNAL